MYLWCSKAFSGLKFSLDKSEIILVGNVDRLKALGAMFGCKAWKFLSYYFGIVGCFCQIISGFMMDCSKRNFAFVEEAVSLERGQTHSHMVCFCILSYDLYYSIFGL